MILNKHKINFKSYNMFHSSDFGGGLPEPKPKFMKHKENGFITVANDGDSDRYGVIDEKGNYISPNIILTMLLKYLVLKGKKGAMIKTVGVSNLVEVVSSKLNVKTITTPVGFKWLSEAMRNNKTIVELQLPILDCRKLRMENKFNGGNKLISEIVQCVQNNAQQQQ